MRRWPTSDRAAALRLWPHTGAPRRCQSSLVPTPGGGWLLSYHQENADPAARDTMFTNRGLMRCIANRIPVDVLRERAPAGRRSQYDVLGLAMPMRWSDGRFFFESLGGNGQRRGGSRDGCRWRDPG
jgi:hypothetical protein